MIRNSIAIKIRCWIDCHPLAFESLLIFLSCIFVYLSNNRTIGSKDNLPSSILAFNWIFNHSINLDNFRGNYFYNQPIWYFIESFNGHLTSAYPIGTAIISFPFYLIFSGILWLNSLTQDSLLNIGLSSIDITKALFDPTRLFCEKLAATLITATAVVIFYLATNLKFNKSVCLLLTFTYAFATQIWITSSQALWQHTAANLVIGSVLLCLLKANRKEGISRRILLVSTGLLCGLIFSVRPTDSVFAIAAIIYSIFAYRRESIFIFFGFPSILLSISWNSYYFGGSILGGYSNQTGLFSFTTDQFVRSFLGLLVSPSRGFFIFSPVMLFAIIGAIYVFKLRANRDEQLVLSLTSAGLLLFITYCFFSVWWQGWTYGCRFLTDTLSVFCFLIGYPLNAHLEQVIKGKKNLLNVGFTCFLTLMAFSTYIEVVGAFSLPTGQFNWDAIPASVDTKSIVGMGRLWNWRDSPIERSTNVLFARIRKSSNVSSTYVQGLEAKIERVSLYDQQSPTTLISSTPGSDVLVQVDLQNTGTSNWLGYESGIGGGNVIVRVRFYDQDNLIDEGKLYIPSTSSGKHTKAIGYISFPTNLGTYRLVFDLVSQGKVITGSEKSYEIQAKVDALYQLFSQEFSNVKVPKVISAGTTFKLFTLVTSRSNFAWLSKVRDFDNKIKYPVDFSYRWISSKGEIEDGERTPLPWSVFYNVHSFYNLCTIGINTKIKAPSQPGNYILRLTMVHEGVAWFDKKGAKPKDIPITIN